MSGKAALTLARRSAAKAASAPTPCGKRASSQPRSILASVGERPPLETDACTGPRSMTAGKIAEQSSGESTVLAQTPAASQSAKTRALTASSSVAATTNHWPFRSAAA